MTLRNLVYVFYLYKKPEEILKMYQNKDPNKTSRDKRNHTEWDYW